jgi:hypothetical protein
MPRAKNRIATTCNHCGVAFEYKASRPEKYCSQTCYHASKGSPKTETQCAYCGKTFLHYAKTYPRRYCSISCGVSARNKTEQNPSYHRDVSGDKNPMYGRGLMGEANPMYGRTGEQNPNWKGGRKIRKDGYVMVRRPEHPNAIHGYVLEHRLVMEQMIGRYLLPTEVVHHRNENPSDNRPENLQIFSSQAEHISQAHG